MRARGLSLTLKYGRETCIDFNFSCISAEILSLCDSFCLVSREFYFDRSPRIFENILGLYRKGELHLTESVCPKDFVGELEYWGLSALYLEPCCAYTLQVITDIDLVISCRTPPTPLGKGSK